MSWEKQKEQRYKEYDDICDRTPKCHCELASEGIKYTWGCAKNHYWWQPLKHKKGKENFWQTVRKCFSRQGLTTEWIQLFLQWARAYILAYPTIQQEQLTSAPTNLDSIASPVNVEKLLKRFETHWCAMDFNSFFCKAVFHSDDGENVSSDATSSWTSVTFLVFVTKSLVRTLVTLVNESVIATWVVV